MLVGFNTHWTVFTISGTVLWTSCVYRLFCFIIFFNYILVLRFTLISYNNSGQYTCSFSSLSLPHTYTVRRPFNRSLQDQNFPVLYKSFLQMYHKLLVPHPPDRYHRLQIKMNTKGIENMQYWWQEVSHAQGVGLSVIRTAGIHYKLCLLKHCKNITWKFLIVFKRILFHSLFSLLIWHLHTTQYNNFRLSQCLRENIVIMSVSKQIKITINSYWLRKITFMRIACTLRTCTNLM